jgi:hypothetical protein
MEGLEPPRLAAPDPKSGAATNYATSGFFDEACRIPEAHSGILFGFKPACRYCSGKKERKFRDISELKNSFSLFKY